MLGEEYNFTATRTNPVSKKNENSGYPAGAEVYISSGNYIPPPKKKT
jgi:hypothetical protein